MIDIIGMILALILLCISCCFVIDKFKNYEISKKGCFFNCLLYFVFIAFALIPICS